MRYFILMLLAAATVFSCGNPWKFVYTNDGALARQQDTMIGIIHNNGEISKGKLRELKINWWVRSAEGMAPGNLVIRQYCITDIFSKRPDHISAITKQVGFLSSNTEPYKSWAEGYHYWTYTKSALVLWMQKFEIYADVKLIQSTVAKIDSGFAFTAYKRNGIWYPAMFGDLFDIPLDSIGQIIAAQINDERKEVSVANIRRSELIDNSVKYQIAGWTIGLNGHTQVDSSVVIVKNGLSDFKYYDGYDKKYESRKAEWTDLLNPKRIFTIPFVW